MSSQGGQQLGNKPWQHMATGCFCCMPSCFVGHLDLRTRHSNVYLQARPRLAQKNVPQHLATRGAGSWAWKAIQARKCNRDPHIGEMQMPPGNRSQGYATTFGCAQQFVLSVLRSVLMMFMHSCARVTHVISTMCTRPWPGKGAEGSWK